MNRENAADKGCVFYASLEPKTFTFSSHLARFASVDVLTGLISVIRTGLIPQKCRMFRFMT